MRYFYMQPAANNVKLRKSLKEKKININEILTCSLAPGTVSGVMNTCPGSSKQCRESCLFYCGMNKFYNNTIIKINRTVTLHCQPDRIFCHCVIDIRNAVKEYGNVAVRFNTTSDLTLWYENTLSYDEVKKTPNHENTYKEFLENNIGKTIRQMFPNVVFYEYTKNKKMVALYQNNVGPNYLATSRHESNERWCKKLLRHGIPCAIIYTGKLPRMIWGYPVVNGDIHDYIWVHSKWKRTPYILGLAAKGSAKDNTDGLVLDF